MTSLIVSSRPARHTGIMRSRLSPQGLSHGHVFHRSPQHPYPVAVRGEGAYLYDREGQRYLDASGGAAVSCLGHSDRAVIEAIQRQLDALPFAHTSFFSNEPMEALARALISAAAPR